MEDVGKITLANLAPGARTMERLRTCLTASQGMPAHGRGWTEEALQAGERVAAFHEAYAPARPRPEAESTPLPHVTPEPLQANAVLD